MKQYLSQWYYYIYMYITGHEAVLVTMVLLHVYYYSTIVGTVQYTTAHSTVQYSTVQYSTQYSTVQYSIAHSTVQ